jgi:AcrR family transcriptional regulator
MVVVTGEATIEKGLRRDAQRNRERILATARELLARDGVEASVEDLSREAGVGMGTLYRHFPTKADLVDAVLEDAFAEIVRAAEEAAACEDGWAGLTGFLDRIFVLHAVNWGLKDVLASSEQGRERAEAMRARMRPLLHRVIQRAQTQGTLRSDFSVDDLPVLFWAGGRVMEATKAVVPDYWRRYLGLVLDGLRADAATPLPRPPLTRAQLARAAKRKEGAA